MSLQLLPGDFEEQVAGAVQSFWNSRKKGSGTMAQGGSRDAVTSGKNMDGFIELVREVAVHCGLPGSSIFAGGRNAVLPGYFRPTKNWDVLVVHQQRLLAVFELKSQVGPSFGNNFNNRSEEVVGAAADLWAAHRESAYEPGNISASEVDSVSEPARPLLNPEVQDDPRPPFLAWLMLLEYSEKSLRPVGVSEPHYRVFPKFRDVSYADRYRILCERLISRRLYSSAALVLSDQNGGLASGAHRSLSEATSIRTLFSSFAACLIAALPEGVVY